MPHRTVLLAAQVGTSSIDPQQKQVKAKTDPTERSQDHVESPLTSGNREETMEMKSNKHIYLATLDVQDVPLTAPKSYSKLCSLHTSGNTLLR